MMSITELQKLVKIFDQTHIEELDYEKDNMKIHLKKSPRNNLNAVIDISNRADFIDAKDEEKLMSFENEELDKSVPKKNDSNIENLHTVVSPMVGTFYNSSSPDENPYVQVGQVVHKDTVICMVEAMKLFNEIESEIQGEIIEVLVENGQLVEFGQPLFLINKK
ncbi:acetyl-CoA carboxylase biotin carboxyl carrier protein [Bacillus sp. NPDC060175]|uniref:acetyl-CoA carboxylase biotin carboxyl carrier protein n=1 Tax=Bacillus sp. NPDC060175 TaxID=3347061 RepID=UPI003669D125